MTTDQTTRRTTPLNRGNLDATGETANERNVVVRLSKKKRRQWSCKTLGMIGLVAAATVFAPSCAVSGSDRPKEASSGIVKNLSPETVRALRKDLGVDPIYVLVVSEKTPLAIGKAPGVKNTEFENEQKLWASQGKVEVRSIKPLTLVRFRRNPDVYCIYYVAAGSLRQVCFEI